jgi:phage terminase large subunit-like protein
VSGSLETFIVVAQVFASVGMFGVIWTIQVVHYPLMKQVPESAFKAYGAEHTARITFIVGPLMAVEGLCVLALLARPPDGIAWWLPWIGAIAEAVAIGTTAFVSAPLHGRLSERHDTELLDRLVSTNWIRTAAWTSRSIVAVAIFLSL